MCQGVVLSERDSSHAMFWCFVFRSCFVYLAQCLPIYTLRLSPDSPALGLVVLVQHVVPFPFELPVCIVYEY